MFSDEVNQAEQQGINPDDILNEVGKQNPQIMGTIQGARQAGYQSKDILAEIERQNTQAAPQGQVPTAPPTPPQGQGTNLPNPGGIMGGVKKVTDFLGITKAAQGTASAIRDVTGQDNQVGQQNSQDLQNTMELIQEAHKYPVGSPQRTRLIHAAANQGQGETTNAQIDPGTQLSNKEVLGSFGNVAGLVGSAAVPGADSLLGKVGQGAALGYASDVSNAANQNQQNILKPGLGTATGAFLPLLTKAVGLVTKGTAAVASGAGTDVINRALQNPDAVAEAATKYAKSPELQQTLVDRAKAAIGDLLHERTSQYGEGIAALSATKPLDATVAANSFAKNVSMYGGKVTDGTLDFTNSALTDTEQSSLKSVWNTVNNWTDNSVKGMDTLRQRIGNEMDNFKAVGNSRSNALLSKVQNDVTNYLGKNVDGYSNVLSNYGTQTASAKNLLSELQTGGKAKPSTQLKNVLNIFKKDPSVTADLYTAMGKQKGDQFLNDVAGNILSEWLPSGKIRGGLDTLAEGGLGTIAALGHPAALAGALPAAAISSPRVVGKVATTFGKAAQAGVTTGLRRAATIGASKLNQ